MKLLFQDVVVCPESFFRFCGSLSDSNDALFYPSALSFFVVILKNNTRLVMDVRPIQEKVLKAVENEIQDALGTNVNLAAQWITAVGLADSNCTFAMNTEWYKPSLIITGLLYHDRGAGLRKWVQEYADDASKDDFLKFLWDFVQDTKEHFDEISSGLFARISAAPPKSTVYWLHGAYSVFSSAEQLFSVVRSKTNSKGSRHDAEVECHRRASSNLALYSRLVLFMMDYDVLPESVNYGNVKSKLRQDIEERYSRVSSSGKQLFIHELIEEIKRFGKDEGFWVNEDPTSLYPPKTLLHLLEPILALQITYAAKLKLMGYFFLDYDSVTNKETFARFRYTFLVNDVYLADQIVSRHKADCTENISFLLELFYDKICLKCLGEHVDECDGPRPVSLEPADNPTPEMKDEKWKNVCDQWAKRFIRDIPRFQSDHLQLTAAEKCRNGELTYITGPRIRRRTTLHETLAEFRSAIELRKRRAETSELSPERKIMHLSGSDTILSPTYRKPSPVGDKDAMQLERILPKENLERVRRILQTPPSARRLDRFSTTGSPRSLESTPEPMPVPQPTSILKSGAKRRLHKDSETGIQPRLRFTLPDLDLDRFIAGSEQTADTIGERSLEVQSENELLESQVSIEKEKENQLDLVPENPDEVAQEQTSEITETFEGVEANDASSFADFEEKAPFPGGSTPLKTKRISKESSYEITVGIPLGNVSEGTGGCNEPKTAVNERPSKDSEGTDVARESVLEKPNRRKPHRPSRDVPALSTPELTSKSFSPRIPSRSIKRTRRATSEDPIDSPAFSTRMRSKKRLVASDDESVPSSETRRLPTSAGKNTVATTSEVVKGVEGNSMEFQFRSSLAREEVSLNESGKNYVGLKPEEPSGVASVNQLARVENAFEIAPKDPVVSVGPEGEIRIDSAPRIQRIKKTSEETLVALATSVENSTVNEGSSSCRLSAGASSVEDSEKPDAAKKPGTEKRKRGRPSSPSRTTRSVSVSSTASAPETTPRRSSSRIATRSTERTRRAISEGPADSPAVSTTKGRKKRLAASDDESSSSSEPRKSRIRAGRKTINQVLTTIEEEKPVPVRSSSRTRKTPTRYLP
ncbi:unnamed protein product [Enterobius vermicularis]|uniref:RING-type domain-containing protein n=1 Tax=Enterobius vermicularis TaxID=51028 RepID=A0A0N4V471_ENTVE|nr:unnamed protein product [Enterobius vermicularis]